MYIYIYIYTHTHTHTCIEQEAGRTGRWFLRMRARAITKRSLLHMGLFIDRSASKQRSLLQSFLKSTIKRRHILPASCESGHKALARHTVTHPVVHTPPSTIILAHALIIDKLLNKNNLTYMHTCIHACIHAYMHTYTHTCMYACMHVCLYACIGAP